MRKLSSLFVLVLALISTNIMAQVTITKEDRTAAIDHLKETQSELMKSVKGLSEAQLNFKPTPESWSIAECVEHLAISESTIFGLVAKSLEAEADAAKKSELKFDDAGLVNMISDRSFKVKTQKPFEPTGKFGSYKGSLDSFKSQRKSNMKYVKSTKDDLRNHYFEFPFGLVDSYQIIRFMSGHTTRHTKQISEIAASEGYPAS